MPDGADSDAVGPPPASRVQANAIARLRGEGGQVLPLALGGVVALIFCALLLAAFGGAATGKSRAQRAADLAALSAARSLRDDFERLFVSAHRPDGSENPRHLGKREYQRRASLAAVEAARKNGVDARRLRIEFPDADSFAPLRARAEVTASLEVAALPSLPVAAEAEAEAAPPPSGAATGGSPSTASGGGYAGTLAYRQGESMRPARGCGERRRRIADHQLGLSIRCRAGGSVRAESGPAVGGSARHLASSLCHGARPRTPERLRLARRQRQALRL